MKLFPSNPRKTFLYAFPVAIASSALAVTFLPQIAEGSTPNLPPVSAQTVAGWVIIDHAVPLSGTVKGITSFPIPSLSGLSNAGPESLIGGSSSISYNIWTNASGSARVQQLEGSNEKDLYVTPRSVWLWDSSKLTATKENIPMGHSSRAMTDPTVSASEIVSKLASISTLSMSGSTIVAGRPAYTLSVTPKASDSLIGSIRISVDAETHLADQIQIFAKGSSTPAASLGFATLTFGAPANSIFNFTPPVGSTIKSATSSHSGSNAGHAMVSQPSGSSGMPQGSTHIVGSGFDSVIVSSGSTNFASPGSIVKALPTVSTPLGTAHLYSTPVFQALILPNGTVVAGAVDTARLVAVASSL